MAATSDDLRHLDRPTRAALAGELIGAGVEIRPRPGYPRGVVGTVIDETLSTWLVRLPGRARPRRYPKHGAAGAFALLGGELPLSGDLLRVRPEDRTKRLLVGGPRRKR